jgi:hypothetical protein
MVEEPGHLGADIESCADIHDIKITHDMTVG